MSAFDITAEIAKQDQLHEGFRKAFGHQPPRLLALENVIVAVEPDFNEAVELLAALMASIARLNPDADTLQAAERLSKELNRQDDERRA